MSNEPRARCDHTAFPDGTGQCTLSAGHAGRHSLVPNGAGMKQTAKDIAAALEAHDNGSLAWREARIAFLARKNDAEFIETFCRLLAAYYGDEQGNGVGETSRASTPDLGPEEGKSGAGPIEVRRYELPEAL